MDHYIVYKGSAVALGAMKREYIATLLPWANDHDVTRGIQLVPPVTYEQELSWYDSLGINSNVVFALLLKEDNAYRYIGHTGIHNIKWPAGRGGTGTLIGDASAHGKGVGTEAKLLLLNHAFNVLGLHKVVSEVKAFNGNSFGHLLKCGYKVIGHRKEHHFIAGRYVDEILFEVFRKDWEPIWSTYKKDHVLPSLTDEQRRLVQEYAGN